MSALLTFNDFREARIKSYEQALCTLVCASQSFACFMVTEPKAMPECFVLRFGIKETEAASVEGPERFPSSPAPPNF